MPKECCRRRPEPASVAVLRLERDTDAVAGRAQEPFGATFCNPAWQHVHQTGVACKWATDQLGMGAHSRRDLVAPLELRKPCERICHPFQRQCEGEDAAPVYCGPDLVFGN